MPLFLICRPRPALPPISAPASAEQSGSCPTSATRLVGGNFASSFSYFCGTFAISNLTIGQNKFMFSALCFLTFFRN